MRPRTLLAMALLAAIIFVVECIAVHRVYASQFLGGNDFYPRWAGARALFLEGRDPYDPLLTKEIAAVLDPQGLQTNSFTFAYPLHVVFVMGPLAFLPYEWAYAVWMVVIQWVAFLLVTVMLRYHAWQPSPLAAAGLLLSSVLFYPIARSIILGQFTVHITLFAAITLLALKSGRDGIAGFFLAATSIKPQMMIFLGPALLLWTAFQRRWRFHKAFLGSGLAFLAGSLLVFPRWPLSFLEDIPRYSATAGGRAPLRILGEALSPPLAPWIQYVVAGLLLLAMLLTWVRATRSPTTATFLHAVNWTIVASLLVPFQTGSTSQVLLAIPLFSWLVSALRCWGRMAAFISSALLLTFLWVLFLVTFSGESPVMFLALPLLSLAILVAKDLGLFEAALTVEEAPAQNGFD